MKKLLQNGNKHRLASTGIGLLVANFIVALLVDQFGLPIHANVIATGSLLIAAITNKTISRYF